ncbi:MAG: 4-vinyl reductase [Candidatus Woesearchaeota archaeon]|nr:4-vinyl reductase [Candidatus Woesearchaeota archaeon]
MAINLNLITKLIGLNALTFSDGEFRIWNVGMMFFPYKVTAFIQHFFEEKFGKKASDALYYIGKLQGYNGTMLFMRKYGIKSVSGMYELFGQQTAMIGVGTVKFSADEKKKEVIIESVANPYMQNYMLSYGKSGEFSDHYLRGLVTGATEAALGEELVGIETKCISKGDSHCVFEIKGKEKWNLKDPSIKSQFPNDDVNYKGLLKKLQINTLAKSSMNYGAIASNFFKTKKVRFDESGKFYLLNVDGMSMPMDTCVIFIETFKELFGKESEKILYEAGELFAKEILKEKPNSAGELNKIFSEWQSFGFGHLELMRADEKGNLSQVKLSQHNFALHYSKIFGLQKNPKDCFMTGLVNGILEAFYGRNLSTLETQCVMQGKSQFCYFETRPEK